MTPDPGLLSAGKVAKRLGVSRQTVHTYAVKGLLPHTRLPSGVLRFREQDIAAFQAAAADSALPRQRDDERDETAAVDAG